MSSACFLPRGLEICASAIMAGFQDELRLKMHAVIAMGRTTDNDQYTRGTQGCWKACASGQGNKEKEKAHKS